MNRVPRDDEPINFVTYDEAVAYVERIGKRLPDELEHEFAATGGGKHKFPWGDSAEHLKVWPFSAVGLPTEDRSSRYPALAGLYSNVAEWTNSWTAPYPSAPADAINHMPPGYQLARVVRGGPYSVVIGKPDSSELGLGVRIRPSFDRSSRYPGLGFRCARSQRPRYLHANP
jgi:formylglycine-generating enzyme required for sulfatase activity